MTIPTPHPSLHAELELARADPSYATFYGIARRLGLLKSDAPPALPGQPLRITLLGTSTLEPFRPYLCVQLLLSGFSPTVTLGAWGQYKQELRTPNSPILRSDPQVVLLVLDARALLGDLYDFPLGTPDSRQALLQQRLADVQEDVQLLLEHTSAHIVLQTLVPPLRPLLGPLDTKEPLGCHALVAALNDGLRTLAQTHARVYLFDLAGTLARVGLDAAMPEKKRLLARIVFDRPAIPAVCQGWDRLIRALFKPARKVLVLDLDNTLWGGVVGEDGVAGIQLGPDAPGSSFLEMQRVAWALGRRGVILAICSKNNLPDVQEVLQQHPWMKLRESDFASIRCSWQEKAQSLREIAGELNLGLDALVFVDDNPVERAKVRETLPEVRVVELPADPAEFASTLADLPDFDTPSLTEEDRARGQLYAMRRQTEALREQSSSLEGFLQQLQTTVRVTPMTTLTVARTIQLLGKTNQLNVTTRRHTEAELRALERRGACIYAITLEDRFGDQGQVGVLILEPEGEGSWCIESLVLSCRVLGRGVEATVLAAADALARAAGAPCLRGALRFTQKNAPARSLYADAGFLLEHADEGGQVWARATSFPALEVPGWVTLSGGTTEGRR